MKRILAAFAGAALAGLAGAAAVAQTESPPPAAEAKNFELAAPTDITLDNGMRVTMVPFGNVPKVTLYASVRVGDLNASGRPGLAELTANMLTEGAGGRDAGALARAAAAMGGQITVRAGAEQTIVGIDVLAEFAGEALGLVADVLRRPMLPAAEFERVQANVARNVAVARSQPGPQANIVFLRALYGDHPFGTPLPTVDEISEYGAADVEMFHAEQFGAARTHLYVVGQFDLDPLTAAVRDAFGEWEAGPERLIGVPTPARERRVLLVDRADAPQATLRLGLPVMDASDDDYVAMTVVNTLLGGSFFSRITANIREDKGYTYSPGSAIDSRYRAAHWVQQADVTTEATGASLIEIFKEIGLVRMEPPANDDLRKYQNYAAGIFVLQNASRGGIAQSLATLDFHGISRARLENYVDDVMAVSPEKVRMLADAELVPEDMTLVVVGPLESVQMQLAQVPELEGVMTEVAAP